MCVAFISVATATLGDLPTYLDNTINDTFNLNNREFTIFIIFSDTYTCSYVVFKVSPDCDENWIFYEFLKLLKNRVKVPVL